MEIPTSRKIDSAPPLMPTPRQLLCALMFLYIGPIALYVIASAMIGQKLRRIVEEPFSLITILSRLGAHYMLGLALLQKEEYAEGIKELERALDLGRGANPKSYIVEEIWQELAKAKYLEWEYESSKRSWELQSLKEACESALKEKHLLDICQMEGFLDKATDAHSAELEALERVFSTAAEADTPTDVPDYLCCKITLDIFRDPVISPSGITYERGVILDHLQKVGTFDPITREPLSESQMIPNLAIKEAVQAFLGKHGWAYKMD
ncbi:E3 ubiquitin-protein ligase CHIP isoform X4 [Camellia sinensis]|uniref:E3 ubiquitin-protein ligase CHIP isoform X4 n=1 Tax=Camellia sinensis TaxID=4442 RepID=UPI001035C279|nr:E3 ubiquitin-protein ligase CHIP isoform X4 [Camellia sinensis]